MAGVTLQVSGNAQLKVGAEVLVFLDHDPESDLNYVVGLAQGLFVIDRTDGLVTVSRDLEGLTFYVSGPRPMPQFERSQTLDEITRVFLPSVDGVREVPGALR